MEDHLRKSLYSEDLIPTIEQFDCGDEAWAIDVSNWFKTEAPAFVSEGTKVYLFWNEQDEHVGCGSLGATHWKIPPDAKRGKVIPVIIIPAFGVRKEFHHKPDGDWTQRYSTEMLRGLVAEAMKLQEWGSVLGLYVDIRNKGAIKLYERIGFKPFGSPKSPDENGTIYQRMYLMLQANPEIERKLSSGQEDSS